MTEFRDLLCAAAANITSGRCESDKKTDNTVASKLDPVTRTHCWSHEKMDIAVPSDETDMIDFYGTTLVYNLNRLITQRTTNGRDDNQAETITPSCLKLPSDQLIVETIIPQTYENTHPKNPKSLFATQCKSESSSAMTVMPSSLVAIAAPFIVKFFK